MIHADASRHPNPKLQQLLNVIYYATPDWKEEWGGQFELWTKDHSQCLKQITVELHACVFTGSKSYHGHPHPLMTPPGVGRNSLAAYFYTIDRVPDENYDGYRNYAIQSGVESSIAETSVVHRSKAVVRRLFPPRVVNRMARLLRQLRRSVRESSREKDRGFGQDIGQIANFSKCTGGSASSRREMPPQPPRRVIRPKRKAQQRPEAVRGRDADEIKPAYR